MLRQGGFGAVYRGVLRGCEVAIKRIVREGDGEKSFTAEVKTIGQLNQKNLVRLLGWCRADCRFFVVYEYMPNRSLDRHLFSWRSVPPTDHVDDDGGSRQLVMSTPAPPLPWEKRYNIVLGLASALKYLHEDLRECVVQRDIKPANIMPEFNIMLEFYSLRSRGLRRLAMIGGGLDAAEGSPGSSSSSSLPMEFAH